ncbi:hypothetical protein H5410_064829 [Solanum commersonii]|uniref:Uncharacterized protein n=1 Tax=Solanum commersonii TaxID=4109 RepID=A0A9J5VYA4_SOLCO|nr:hypothetical protein H5410_064829 [Solanum commersonii]
MGVAAASCVRGVEARSVGCRLGRWRKERRWIGTPLGQVMGALRMGVTGGVMRRRVEARNDVRIGTPLGQVMGALRMGVTGGVMRRRVEARNDVRIGTPLGQVMGALRMGVTGGVMRRRVEARSVGWRLGRWRKEKRRSDWDAVRTGDGGVEDGRDGRRHASSRGG